MLADFVLLCEDAIAQGAASAASDVGIWVRIKPNNDIVVRMTRSEMGQGTITGLAQLVVEELEGDWKKVKFEYISPKESFQEKAKWGDFVTTGSRGIRGAQDYVRRGGAVAREMLKQAAANQWKVPVAEIKAIHDHQGYKRVRRGLARHYEVSAQDPDLQIIEADLNGGRRLVISHHVRDGIVLDKEQCERTMYHLARLWGYRVRLIEVEDEGGKVLKEHEVLPIP